MFRTSLFILLCSVLQLSFGDWESDWMQPVQEQLDIFNKDQYSEARRFVEEPKAGNDDPYRGPGPIMFVDSSESPPSNLLHSNSLAIKSEAYSATDLKAKIESTLLTAQALVDTLRTQIEALTAKETFLKEVIANGRSGLSVVTVTPMGKTPRFYIVRDGYWSVCNGMIQYPQAQGTMGLFMQRLAEPRCIGQEIPSKTDPCIFNSLITYETTPIRRKQEYTEDVFFCLKSSFKNTLEQYLSVPRSIVNQTCHQGTVKPYADFNQMCGIRTLTEYSYYPHKSSSAAELPIEYCVEKDDSCKMIIAWHISNAAIENFEFLKDEEKFKKFFLKWKPFGEQAM